MAKPIGNASKGHEKGKRQFELAGQYILDDSKMSNVAVESPISLEEMEKLLKHDLPKGDQVSKKLIGMAESPIKTNALELKKSAYKSV